MIFIDQALLVFLAITLSIVIAITSHLITSRIFQNRIRALEYAVSVQSRLLFREECDDDAILDMQILKSFDDEDEPMDEAKLRRLGLYGT